MSPPRSGTAPGWTAGPLGAEHAPDGPPKPRKARLSTLESVEQMWSPRKRKRSDGRRPSRGSPFSAPVPTSYAGGTRHSKPLLLDPQDLEAPRGELEADVGPPASLVADRTGAGEIAVLSFSVAMRAAAASSADAERQRRVRPSSSQPSGWSWTAWSERRSVIPVRRRQDDGQVMATLERTPSIMRRHCHCSRPPTTTPSRQ